MPYWSIYCLWCNGYIVDALLECVPAKVNLRVLGPNRDSDRFEIVLGKNARSELFVQIEIILKRRQK